MTIANPFKKPPLAPKGDPDFETLYHAVGYALNHWEHAENKFAHLFGTIIRPGRNSYAARRAYGAIATARGRKEMLESVAAVFFRNFPHATTQATLKTLLTHYVDAGARRNELAHGIVGGDRDGSRKFLGYFLVPSMWNTNKRALDSAISYRYSTKEIADFRANFTLLGGRAIGVADSIDEIFRSSPEKRRQRW